MSSRRYRWVVAGVAFVLVAAFGVYLGTTHGAPTALDRSVMDTVTGLRRPTLTSVIKDVTVIFSPLAVAIWTALLAALLLWRDRSLVRALPVLVTVAAAGVVGEIVKLAVSRPRPPAIDQLGAAETTYSYPSGHVIGTTALVVVAVSVCAASVGARVAAGCLAAATVVVCAATRLYLGAHWVTDVLAAICVGVGVALVVPVVLAAVIGRLAPHLPAWVGVPAANAGSKA
ncbi:phosphatase PAP2 family protein [Gordonia sp. DT30]|uniref:phosphatase PAP2 family protein n=1 Tax=Gordonia sp. DT30 TaxID=3416546 RepID=UPI003CF85E64